jgi:hypothetical protein
LYLCCGISYGLFLWCQRAAAGLSGGWQCWALRRNWCSWWCYNLGLLVSCSCCCGLGGCLLVNANYLGLAGARVANVDYFRWLLGLYFFNGATKLKPLNNCYAKAGNYLARCVAHFVVLKVSQNAVFGVGTFHNTLLG